ncbi:MAG: hypothetical protein R3C53_10785 [Pirellulaceae bacterium]
MSLRADQNFNGGHARIDGVGNNGRGLELHLHRNAFQVSVRLLRSSSSGGENQTPTVGIEAAVDQAGKLALATIKIPEFWVQREAPELITQTGFEQLVVNHFEDIDQAEFEFYVRLDSLTGSGKGVVVPWQRVP